MNEADGKLSLLQLDGLRALITGAGSGLGRQMAHALGEAGADLVLCGRREGPLQETAATARAGGVATHVLAVDVTDEADLGRLAEFAGRVDILVNNAGASRIQSWGSVSLDQWRQVMALNLDAPFRLCQLFVPGMVERGWGRIINIASIYGTLGGDPRRYPGIEWDIPAYVVSKHALIGMTRYLSTVLADQGVCVNALSPGMFPTEGNQERLTPEVREALIDGTPMRRLGSEDDLKAAVVFLASPGAKFVTGQNLIVDGGWSVW